MARRPFFSGNYGSSLGSTAQAADIIARAGQQRGQALAGMGAQIGGMIQQYGLNKEKRAELTGEIEAMLPQYMQKLTMSGDEESDKKNMQRIEKFRKGDSSMADLKGLAGELAMKDKVEARAAQNEARTIANQMGKVNLDIAEQLKTTQINIGKNQGVMSDLARRLAEETDPKKRELLKIELQDNIDNLNQLGQPRRDATEAGLELQEKTSKAGIQTLPKQTENIIKGQEVQSKQLDIENELIDIVGIEGYAQMKADDLKTLSDTNKAKLEQTKAYAGYLQNKGLADLITAAKKSSPTFKERFAPLVEIGGKLLTTNVEMPGSKKRVPFKEYLELNEEDPTRYPMNGLPGDLFAQLQAIEKSQQQVLREQQVEVNVPDEDNEQGEQTTQLPVPAYKKAMQRIGEETQEEYMNTPGVGGMGFPFMP